MPDTSQRYLAMLEAIPRWPSAITVEQLMAALERRGHIIDKRSVQRDLNKLAEQFGLSHDKDGKFKVWYFEENAPVSMLPSMDEHTALAFQLVKAFLTPMLPPETLEMVKPWFDISDSKLASRKTRSARWQEKILIIPPGLPRQTPRIDPDVQSGVTQSLLEEVPILIHYKSRQAKSARRHLVSPLGLVMRERISYLIAYIHEKETVSQFAMHRIVSMDWDEEEPKYRRPKDFNLKQYVEEGNLAIQKGQAKDLDLELWLDAQVAVGVKECPVNRKQTLAC